MNRPNARIGAKLASVLAVAGLLLTHVTSGAPIPHLSILQPGGMPGRPVITGVYRGTNNVTVTWDGPSGYYQLYEKQGLTDGTWQPIGRDTNWSRLAVVPTTSTSAMFKVSGPSAQYAGWSTCAECHQPTLTTVVKTAHAAAFTNATFIAQGGQTDPSCLVCHSVGYGLPTGFRSKSTTPQLAAVECENCHGPAGNHAANPGDPIAVPRVELAANMCGGCHNAQYVPARVSATHPPLYEDWNQSPHRSVVPEVQANFTGPNSTNYISQCGRCHSGSVREALTDNESLPSKPEAAAIGIVCSTCHDPHQNYTHTNVLRGVVVDPVTGFAVTNNQLGRVYTNQIPYPFASTNDFYLTTSGPFTNNLNINICAQCHNHRGASWQSTSRPPHKSPQYNMLLGTVGLLTNSPARPQPSTHAFFEKQCVRCHMQTSDGSSGHHFTVTTYDTCLGCHNYPEALVSSFTAAISDRIQQIKSELDYWAANKAPAALWTKYGNRAWEYTTPGDLSPGGPGPNSTEQALIPSTIQKARFNLYIVLNDGSYGVHNAKYADQLLDAAETWIAEALNQ